MENTMYKTAYAQFIAELSLKCIQHDTNVNRNHMHNQRMNILCSYKFLINDLVETNVLFLLRLTRNCISP